MWSLLHGFSGERRRARAIALAALVLVLLMGLAAGFDSEKSAHAADGKVEVIPLSRGYFTDEARGLFTLRLQGEQSTTAMVLPNAGEVVSVKVILEPGEAFPWHVHPGTAIATIAQGDLKVTQANDCSERTYASGQSFLEATNRIHEASNEVSGDVVVYATFVGIPAGSPATIPMERQDYCGG